MKLYMLTTSLNLSNILSSSILFPPSLYSEKITGFKRYREFKGQNENMIFLYKNKKSIDFKDDKYRERRIIFEIDLDVKKLNKIDDETYVSNDIIYFDSDKVKIYFENEEELLGAAKEIVMVDEVKDIYKYFSNILTVNFEKMEELNQEKNLKSAYDSLYYENVMKNFYLFDSVRGIVIGLISSNYYDLIDIDYDEIKFLEQLVTYRSKYKGYIDTDIKALFIKIFSKLNIKISIEDNKNIKINKILKFSNNDIKILNIIYNNIIKLNYKTYDKSRFSVNYIKELLILISREFKDNDIEDSIINDLRNVYSFIIEDNSRLELCNIENKVIENLFIVLDKGVNFSKYSKDEKIQSKYILANSIYSGIVGYESLSRIYTMDLYKNEIIKYVIENKFRQIYNNIILCNDSNYYYRRKIYKLIYKLKNNQNINYVIKNRKKIECESKTKIKYINKDRYLDICILKDSNRYTIRLYNLVYINKYNNFKKTINKLGLKKEYRYNYKYNYFEIFKDDMTVDTYGLEKEFFNLIKLVFGG